MSWQDFHRLIDQQNSDITAWMQAIEANSNTPEDALKAALLDIIHRQDMAMLEDFTGLVIALVRNADGLLDVVIGAQDAIYEFDGAIEPVVVMGLDSPGEDYDVNPYLLTGAELARTEQRRMAGVN